MKILKNVTLPLMALSLFVAAPATAGMDKKTDQGSGATSSNASKESQNMKQVQGTILQHKFVNIFDSKKAKDDAVKNGKTSDQKTLVILMKTDKGSERLIVDLGPMKDAPKIKDGETKLQVEGQMIEVGSKDLFVAKKAKIDGTQLNINRQS